MDQAHEADCTAQVRIPKPNKAKAYGFSGSPGSGISVGYRETRRIGILYRLISALGSLSAGERAVPSVPDVAGPNRLLDGERLAPA